jgi:carbon starvation protein CstA
MVRLKRIVKGATLIETLVAMTLLVTAFTLSFLVITSIKRSYNNNLFVYAYIVADSILQESDSINVGEQDIMCPGLTMSFSKKQYNSNPYLFISKITVISQDSVKLFEINSIRKENNFSKKQSKQ